MGEILEIVDGIDIIPNNRAWVIPQDMIRKIGAAEYMGKPLVRRVKYYPSRQTRLYQKYEQLTVPQQAVTQAIARDVSRLDELLFAHEPLPSKHNILDTLLDYHQFINVENTQGSASASEPYRKILSRRYALPPGIDHQVDVIPVAPHQGRSSSLVQVGVLHNSARGEGMSFTMRPAYYDALDASHGHVKHAALTMGEFQWVSFTGEVQLRRIELLKIHSVKTKVTGLPGDNNATWRLGVGWESQNLTCTRNCLVGRLQADRGLTWALGGRLFTGVYLGAAIQDNRHDQGNLYAKATGFAMVDLPLNVKAHLEYETRSHLDGHLSGEDSLKFTARYQPVANAAPWDFRVGYEKNQGEELTVSLGYYW